MNCVDSENSVWTPRTEEDKALVRQQMNRLLQTNHFRNSRRYPVLFRFIVEETLEGRGEYLKERLLGVRVFDRPADYDTAADPIVRVTIAEIRKRIAQYYHEEAHDSEMRIELPQGRYVPEFHFSKDERSDHHQTSESMHLGAELQIAESAVVHSEVFPVSVPSAMPGRKRRFSSLVRWTLGAATVLLIALGAGVLWRCVYPSALDELWKPFLANRRTVIFCLPVGTKAGDATAAAAGILVSDYASTKGHVIPQVPPASESFPASTFLAYEKLDENVVFSDALATLRISNYLAARNRKSNFRPNVLATLDDLRQGPVVLVGGLDNQWTLRALASLRYRFACTNQEQYWIVDTKNPSMRDWMLDPKAPLTDVKHDFAIIARVHDESTGQIEMIVAGIGMSGTAAAGEFLVDPQQMEELRRRVGSGFRDHDFEAVLSTDVVNGIAGSPRILAVTVR
jgi:hypothetical protein